MRTALLWLQGPRAVRSPLRACNAERRERVKLFGRGGVSAIAFLGHLRIPYMYKHRSYMTGLGLLSLWNVMIFSSQRTEFRCSGPPLTVATCQRTQVSSSASRELSSEYRTRIPSAIYRNMQVVFLHLHDHTCHCYMHLTPLSLQGAYPPVPPRRHPTQQPQNHTNHWLTFVDAKKHPHDCSVT